jgi:hypothetical protein
MRNFLCDSAFGRPNTVLKSTRSDHRTFVIILAFVCAHALGIYKLVFSCLYSESALFELITEVVQGFGPLHTNIQTLR